MWVISALDFHPSEPAEGFDWELLFDESPEDSGIHSRFQKGKHLVYSITKELPQNQLDWVYLPHDSLSLAKSRPIHLWLP